MVRELKLSELSMDPWTTHRSMERVGWIDQDDRISLQQLMHETRTPSHVAIPVLSECTMGGGLYDPANRPTMQLIHTDIRLPTEADYRVQSTPHTQHV